MGRKDFRGEVWTTVHPKILERMVAVNDEPIDDNDGRDGHSRHAVELMQRFFKERIWTTFAINGTAANILALKSMLPRNGSIVCAAQTHVNTHECGAFEYTLGCKILDCECDDGKLTPDAVAARLKSAQRFGYRPQVVVVTQPTELGTMYSLEELKALCDFAHSRKMAVYVDGARIGNAVVALNTTLTELIEGTGVDAFSWGATKAGAMFGEMVVFRREEWGGSLPYLQKQSMQHLDKSQFLGVQAEYLLESGLWLENARLANQAAKRIEARLHEVGIPLRYPVETNMVFCILTPEQLKKVTKVFDAHYWDESTQIVRIAATYLTTDEAIAELASCLAPK
ncbi:MAG: aminotransferase class I/II-fold pyridoxal phosphate-dependent enzyme [Victivallales bacterium]|nr:aminotransferase class I/II-fold pyridoxal phosphate-dependent enzyme [Victivallales bacterium]